jgi:gliding motility-associated protein GldL
VYELQLQASDDHYQAAGKLKNVTDSLSSNIQDTLSDTQKYKEEMEKLTRNISALNSVYGNMLTAMNFNINR